MKAKYVYESVNFERGRTPKKSMNIGLTPINVLKIIQTEFENIGVDCELSTPNADGDRYSQFPSLTIYLAPLIKVDYPTGEGFWQKKDSKLTPDMLNLSYGSENRIAGLWKLEDYENLVVSILKKYYNEAGGIDEFIKEKEEELENLKRTKDLIEKYGG